MSHLKQTELMHAVLDREATPGEARELELLLVADPVARAQFEELQRLFDGLAAIPKEFPPEGLVASVLAKVPSDSTRRGGFDQPLSPSRVFGQTTKGARGTTPVGSATVHRISQPGPFFRGTSMSQQSGSLGKRKVWIGIGIAAAALILVLFYTVDFPPGGKDAVGTIVPAQRYRAPQVTEGVQPGDQSAQTSQGSQAASANQAAGGVTAGVTSGTASGITSGVTSGTTSGITSGVTSGTTSGITSGVTSGTTSGITSGVTSGTASGITSGVTSGTTSGITSGVTSGTASGITSGVTSGTASGITSGVTSGTTSGITSGVTSGTASGITSGVTSGTTSGITSGVTSGTASGVTN